MSSDNLEIVVSNFPKTIRLHKIKNTFDDYALINELNNINNIVVIVDKSLPTNNSIFGLVTRFNNTENRNLVKKIDVFFRGITPGTRFPIYSLHVEMREGETIRLIIKKTENQH